MTREIRIFQIRIFQLKRLIFVCFSLHVAFAFVDWATTFFYFQHLKGFIEGNGFVRHGVPLELNLFPILGAISMMYLLIFLALKFKPFKRFFKGVDPLFIMALTLCLVEPFSSSTAPLLNLLWELNVNLLTAKAVLATSIGLQCFVFSISLVKARIIGVEKA
jgi:hypothetical protein